MDYTKDNEIIINFIGADVTCDGEYDLFGCTELNPLFEDVESDDPDAKHFYHPSEMLFHKSWDWLIIVVEYIESLDYLGGIVDIKQGMCKISSRALGDKSIYANVSYYHTLGVGGKFKAVFEAILQYIKWYNENCK